MSNVSYEVTPAPTGVHESLFAIPNWLTAVRPPLAGVAAYRLITGQRGAFGWAATAMATDLEGNVGRAIDRWFPGSGLGCTELGARLDPLADAGAATVLAPAVLAAPNIHPAAKIAGSIVAASEGKKILDASELASNHRQQTGGILDIKVSWTAKKGTFFKLAALGLATATNELRPGKTRTATALLSLGSAAAGAVFTEKAWKEYKQLYS